MLLTQIFLFTQIASYQELLMKLIQIKLDRIKLIQTIFSN